MKPYNILKDFQGSQTGVDALNLFKAGTQAELSDYLAAVVVPAGLASPVKQPEYTDTQEAVSTPAEQRETKVETPEEVKAVNLDKMTKVELVTYAKTEFDLDLTPDSMTKAEMIAEIETTQNG